MSLTFIETIKIRMRVDKVKKIFNDARKVFLHHLSRRFIFFLHEQETFLSFKLYPLGKVHVRSQVKNIQEADRKHRFPESLAKYMFYGRKDQSSAG